MRTFLFTFSFILFILIVNAQTIQVLNSKTNQPIEGVLLFSENFSTQTDQSGKAKIDNFTTNERILFKHSSYVDLHSTREKIEKQGKIVWMNEDPIRLDEIVISANHWEQSKAEIPNKIISISASEIEHYNPQTTADLVSSSGGVFVQKSQMGGGSPMIRGFSANRILLVVDGIRMNNAIYRSGNLQNIISLDANSIENTEIIFGPGSVIYGSDALGGVMSFSTLKPKLSTETGTDLSGKIMSRFSSANFEKTVHGTFNLGGKKWAALISSTFSGFDDLKMGSYGRDEYLRPEFVLQGGFDGTDKIVASENSKIQTYTQYSQFNFLGKVRFRPNEKLEINLSGNHSQTSNIPRYDRLIVYKNNKLRYGEWYYGPQILTLFSGQLQYKSDCALFDKLNFLSGYQNYTESRYDRNLNNPVRNGRQEDLSIFSVNLDLGKTIDDQNEFFYGVESYINKINSEGSTKNLLTNESEIIPSRYPDDSEYGSVAGYFSYKLNLKKKVILQAGTRYTYTWLYGEFNPEYYNFPFSGFDMKNSALIGNLGAVWHPTTEWQINTNFSTGFRSPNIDDVAKVFDSEPGNVVVPNPDLKPEYARNIELGIIKSFNEKASFEVTAFYTRLKDAMVRRDFTLNRQDSIIYDGTMSKVEALVNADAADIYGASFVFEYVFTGNLRTSNDLTITEGEDSDGYPVRHAPPLFGSSHLIYENQKLFLDLYADYNGKLDYEELAPSEQDKPYMYATDENGNPFSPAWWTLNLKFNYKLTSLIALGGGIENILDKRYRTYSSGIVSPGLNFIFSVSARF
ncbi:MAG TPA: TonB-dependent receptor [Draconibacterium sp.]|nr:TonB-dependent receptor [Draconibacterium sp.]